MLNPPEKRYKLYKDGKKWVVGAIAVAGLSATMSLGTVSADTTEQTNTTQTAAQGANTSSDAASKTDNGSVTTTDTGTTQENTVGSGTSETATTQSETSTVPKSVPDNTTQDDAKKTIDNSQQTVNQDADNAKNAGVDVNTNPTKNVTLNPNNAASESNRVLTDLNQQDQALIDATAKQKANDEAYQQSVSQREEALKQGQTDLKDSKDKQDEVIKDAKSNGLDVSLKVVNLSPEYQSLSGLTGQQLLDAMSNNIKLYNEAVQKGVAGQDADTATLKKLIAEYQAKYASYQAEKARIEADNAAKKLAFDNAMKDFMNGTNVEMTLAAKTQTDQGDGTLKTFMDATVNSKTGEFTLSHDMNDNGTIIGRGKLTGKIIYTVTSNGDGSETIHVTSIELYHYSYEKYANRTNPNSNINFHVYDNNGNELFVKVHDGGSSFDETINKSFSLDKTFVILPNETSSVFEFMRVDDNWEINTHGQVSVQFKNTNAQPTPPDYETIPDEPAKPEFSAQQFTVDELPEAEAPAPQKVSITPYQVTTTPEDVVDPSTPVATPTQLSTAAAPAQALPETGAENYDATQMVMAGLAATIMSIGLVAARRKYAADDSITKPEL